MCSKMRRLIPRRGRERIGEAITLIQDCNVGEDRGKKGPCHLAVSRGSLGVISGGQHPKCWHKTYNRSRVTKDIHPIPTVPGPMWLVPRRGCGERSDPSDNPFVILISRIMKMYARVVNLAQLYRFAETADCYDLRKAAKPGFMYDLIILSHSIQIIVLNFGNYCLG